MRKIRVVIETIIELIPDRVIEDTTDRVSLKKRLKKLKDDCIYSAPENPIYFDKTAEALNMYLGGTATKKYKEIIADYFSDKISREDALKEYEDFYK